MERKRKDSCDICVPVVWQAKTLALADDYRGYAIVTPRE
jgi:hypothetical protein